MFVTFMSFFSFYLLLNQLIPLDLLCSTEIQKLVYTSIVVKDSEMISPESGQTLIARSLNLWEELGEIEYLFCDKTGTLTQNKLNFKSHCSTNKDESDFWRCLNLCHECTKIGEVFNGPSLDEVCLLTHSASTDFSFKCKNSKEITLQTANGEEIWEVIKVVGFTAETKSMKVFVKSGDRMVVFIKGADSSILPLCKDQEQDCIDYGTEMAN
jgi:magnesium-transporting ATPase (P-type)